MERLYLILFLILTGSFIYWYRNSVWENMYRKRIISKKKHKHKKESEKHSHTKRSKKPDKRESTESSDDKYKLKEKSDTSDSSDSRIRRKKQVYKKAYKDQSDDTITTQDSLSMDDETRDSIDSSLITLDTDITNDLLSKYKKR